MTAIGLKNMKQFAVLWRASGQNEFSEPTIENPVEIKCRWERKENQSLEQNNNVVTHDAIVFVPCEIPEKSILWLGRLMDKPNDSELTELMEVVHVSNIPNRRNTKTEHVVYTRFFSNNIPSIT